MIARAAVLSLTLIICTTTYLPTAAAETVRDGLRLLVSSSDLPVRSFKSFREWKIGMAAVAQDRIKQTQALILQKQRQAASAPQDPNLSLKATGEAGLNQNLLELQQQAEKDQYQLSIAKDLTISDYFVGYLTKQKDLAAAIKEVSGRLSPEEVSELMYAYANNFFSSKPSTSISPARADVN